MTEPELNTRLQTITPPDGAARAAAHARQTAAAAARHMSEVIFIFRHIRTLKTGKWQQKMRLPPRAPDFAPQVRAYARTADANIFPESATPSRRASAGVFFSPSPAPETQT